MNKLVSAFVLIVVAAGQWGCAASFSSFDSARPGTADAARDVLDTAITAQGGYLYDAVDNITVRYDGRWYRAVKFLQPVLVDAGYRKGSEERLHLAEDRLVQRHTGPEGTKLVVRGREQTEVSYNGALDDDATQRAASALVADAYTMFLTGPSFFRRRQAELRLLEPAMHEGRQHERIVARLRPGFGLSAQDDAVLWIDAESGRLKLVHFTIEGLASTRGAHVDVAFAEHRAIEGFVWPTEFFERVRGPVKVKAHRWEMQSLELQRGGADAG